MTEGSPPFRRVLVANRGEIAVRIFRTCRDMGIRTVAVHSDADADASHVRAADEAVRLGPAAAAESYLRGDRIIEAARAVGAEAIHPGYGFLSEQAAFASAVEAAGITFIGPSPATLEALGDKLAARRSAVAAGVPIVPGTFEPLALEGSDWSARVAAQAAEVGYPLLVKAAAGGGGRGMRRVDGPDELEGAVAAAARESMSAFGDGSVYLERLIQGGRHVEVQLLGDSAGRVVALGERDCSTQRRHQKLVEEAPAPGLTFEQRVALHGSAVRVAAPVGLRNAATAEFLLGPDGTFHFLEVNARLQVEHGITELVTGLDLVREQIAIAAGGPLSDAVLAAAERAATPARHAIELRISAEDPARDFAPNPGRLSRWREPAGPGVLMDSGVEAGTIVTGDYDSLLAKVLVEAPDRPWVLARARRAVAEFETGGVQTTLPFHAWLLGHDAFVEGRLRTDLVARDWDPTPSVARAVERSFEVVARAFRAGAVVDRGPADAPRPDGQRAVPRHGWGPEPWGPIVRSEPWGPSGPSHGTDRAVRAMGLIDWSEPLRLTVEGVVGAEIDLDPVDPVGSASGAADRDPEVRALPVSSDERAAGIRRCEVTIDGWVLRVLVGSAARAALRGRARQSGAQRTRGPADSVRAQMPGRIVRLWVAEGDTVAAGQRLLAIEAMKMENEVRAAHDGTIEAILVELGGSVELGAELLRLR